MTEAKSYSGCAKSSSGPRLGRKIRLMKRVGLVAMLGLVGWTSSATQPMPAAATTANAGQVVSILRPEVRLRKLHLVRPDLIMYPLSYDIYC